MVFFLILLTFAGATGLVYPYLIYPAVLAILGPSRKKRDFVGKSDFLPRISMLLAVHNERQAIRDKVKNFLEADYDPEAAELIVVSDGSDDGTDEILQELAGTRVRPLYKDRAGKTSALNDAARMAKGDIFVFTDANTMFDQGALRSLVEPLSDPDVGLVTGWTVEKGENSSQGTYGAFESFLKERESRFGIVAGADGAIYALRRLFYEPLPEEIINDFFHPVQVSLRGYRSVLAPGARGVEPGGTDAGGEFRRQRRMACQAVLVVRHCLADLWRNGKLLHLWVLGSHKAIRWIHVPLGAVTFISLGCVVILTAKVKLLLLLPALWAAVLAGALLRPGAFCRLPVIGWIFQLEFIHAAYAAGLIDFVRGRSYVTWRPREGD